MANNLMTDRLVRDTLEYIEDYLLDETQLEVFRDMAERQEITPQGVEIRNWVSDVLSHLTQGLGIPDELAEWWSNNAARGIVSSTEMLFREGPFPDDVEARVIENIQRPVNLGSLSLQAIYDRKPYYRPEKLDEPKKPPRDTPFSRQMEEMRNYKPPEENIGPEEKNLRQKYKSLKRYYW